MLPALLKTPGTSCGSSTECASGFCADGVCCNGACSGSCDRCNLSASNGTCSPAPASDPGSPACGGAVVCNGTLADCPITCASGCPSNTYCSGTYCSAKKTNGVTCSAPTECTSNNCVDGVCCDTGCAGACDACSVAQGASADGTCTLLGPTRICRAAATTCDQEERCTGTSAACPGNAFTGAGVGCGTTTFSGWSGCDAGTGCATNGVQTRTRTEQLCNGTNATCTASNATESQGCMRPTEGVSCGTTTYGTWSTCTYAATCTTSGSRTRVRTDPVCASGTCSAVQTTETDTAGCTRTTDNVSCGSASYGTWSACSFGTTCAETGSRSRARTDPVCQTGACGSTMATETDTSMCTRTTGGQSCGTTNTGAWGSCSYGATCATSGSRTRAVTTYSCGSGACNSSMTTETDTSACGRTTSGTSCGTTQYGAWSACSFGATCSNSGSRTRSVTTYACDGAASCQPSMSTETDTAGCGRNTNGTSCGTTTYGSYTACSYGGACSDSGSRTRSVTTLTCSSGSCASSPGSETDTAGCARNTTGATCASTSCGNCICPACERTCTVYTCAGGACSGSPDSLFCSCGGGCAIKAPGPRE